MDKNPAHGKDSDGFDEEILIMDESGEDTSGIKEAIIEDPLKPKHLYIDKPAPSKPATPKPAVAKPTASKPTISNAQMGEKFKTALAKATAQKK
jgi:hypothetical protein